MTHWTHKLPEAGEQIKRIGSRIEARKAELKRIAEQMEAEIAEMEAEATQTALREWSEDEIKQAKA